MRERFAWHSISARSVARVSAAALLVSTALLWTAVSPPSTAAAGTPVQIQMKNFAFAPQTISITVGQPLMWTNDDVVPHTTTANEKAWNSGEVAPGHNYTVMLTKPGTYDYACTIHTFMHAKIVVTK
jgi:plastocyanin